MNFISTELIYQTLSEKHRIGVICADQNLQVLYASPRAGELLGTEKVSLGSRLSELSIELESIEAQLEELVSGVRDVYALQIVQQDTPEGPRYISLIAYQAKWSVEEMGLLLVVQENAASQYLKEISQEYSQLRLDKTEALASRDELTGLGNRKLFDNEMPKYLEEVRADGDDLLIVRLKYSHPDDHHAEHIRTLVQSLAKQLIKTLRHGDQIYHTANNQEFVLVLLRAGTDAIKQVEARLKAVLLIYELQQENWKTRFGLAAMSEADFEIEGALQLALDRLEKNGG